MGATEAGDRGRAEPIDVDFEPADRPPAQGIGMGAAVALSAVAALGGAAMGALAPRTPALAPLLDAAAPDELTQVRQANAAAARTLAEAQDKLRLIDASGGVSPEFAADYQAVKASLGSAQAKVAKIESGLKLLPNGPPETEALRKRILALESLPADPNAASPAQLYRTVAAMQARVEQLEASAQRADAFEAAAGASPAEIAQRLQNLATQSKEIETRLNAAASAEEVAKLSAALTTLQGEFANVAAGSRSASEAARAAFAVAAATDAARSSGPFDQAYSALQAVLPEDPNVIALATLSKRGAPTRAELRDEFAALELDIVRAARQAEAGGGFWGHVQATMAQFIVVRSASAKDTANSRVERAAARIAADDFTAAVAELSRLTGAPAKVAAPWLAKARQRLEIDTRLAAIRAELSRRG